jgi:serine/threonine-protein kinase
MTSETEELLGGRFALDSRIGTGNYAEIFRAIDHQTGNLVAIKTLKPEHAFDPHAVALFKKEAEVGSAISHVNVVKIWSCGIEDGSHYIVMELVRGISLRRRLNLKAPLPAPDALRIIEAVLRGLEAIHAAGYVHRDIKPQNILLEAGGMPKITDFGIALGPGEPWQPADGLALGTAAYIAPEQAAGEAIGPQADVYSAGAVLFEMLTGESPFPGDDPLDVMNRHLFETPRDPRALNPKISPALAAVILRALAKDPSDRFPSVRRMREALELLDPSPTHAAITRRFMPVGQLAWTIPIAPSRRLPARLLGMPTVATFVSGLLLVVLFIVLMLALVSSVANASGSKENISSSSPPTGQTSGAAPNNQDPSSRGSHEVATWTVPNWTTSASQSTATSTPAVVVQQSPTSTPTSTPEVALQPSPAATPTPTATPVPTATATPELVDVSTTAQNPVPSANQAQPLAPSAVQQDRHPRETRKDKPNEPHNRGTNQQAVNDPTPAAHGSDQSADRPNPDKQKPDKARKLGQALWAGTDHADHGDHGHGRSSSHHGHD